MISTDTSTTRTLREDVLAVVASTRGLGLSFDEIAQDVAIWPLTRNQPRAEVDRDELRGVVDSLLESGELQRGGDGYVVPAVAGDVDDQLELFD